MFHNEWISHSKYHPFNKILGSSLVRKMLNTKFWLNMCICEYYKIPANVTDFIKNNFVCLMNTWTCKSSEGTDFLQYMNSNSKRWQIQYYLFFNLEGKKGGRRRGRRRYWFSKGNMSETFKPNATILQCLLFYVTIFHMSTFASG